MRTSLRPIVLLATLSLFLIQTAAAQAVVDPGEAPQGPADPFLADLDAKYRSAVNEQVESGYSLALAKLTAEYLKSLQRGEDTVRDDLDAVVAWRNEQKRVKGEPPIEESKAKPEALEHMRATYELQKQKLDADREAKHGALTEKYVAALAQREKDFTRERKIEEALVVKRWRETIEAGLSSDSPSAAREIRFQGTFAATANIICKDGQIWVVDRSVAEFPTDLKVNGKQWKPNFGPDKTSEKLTIGPKVAPFSNAPVKLSVRKDGDGGPVEIAAQPTAENGQQLTIYLEDTGGGWGEFDFTLSW